MILVDYNPLAIAAMMQQLKGNTKLASVDFFRHMVLNSLRAVNRKFAAEYGPLIICADGKHSWRKDIFPHYKAHRKQAHEDSDVDWTQILNRLSVVFEEIAEVSPFKTIKIEHVEADDIIGTICSLQPDFGLCDPILILSRDYDFHQLQQYPMVEQYDWISKKKTKCDNVATDLFEHIVRGDTGDGIPNIKSEDDSLINPSKRQKPISAKWLAGLTPIDGQVALTEEESTNFQRNKKLIDLTQIPDEIRRQIVDKYHSQTPERSKGQFLNYLIRNRLVELMDRIEDFFVEKA